MKLLEAKISKMQGQLNESMGLLEDSHMKEIQLKKSNRDLLRKVDTLKDELSKTNGDISKLNHSNGMPD